MAVAEAFAKVKFVFFVCVYLGNIFAEVIAVKLFLYYPHNVFISNFTEVDDFARFLLSSNYSYSTPCIMEKSLKTIGESLGIRDLTLRKLLG